MTLFSARAARFASVVLALLSILGAGSARAGTLKVGPGQAFATIQAAVTAALANSDADDTISISPGDYAESVFITITGTNAQENLTLKRNGSGLVRVLAPGSTPAFQIENARGVSLKNLTVRSGSSSDGTAAIQLAESCRDIEIESCTGFVGDDVGVAFVGEDIVGVKVKGSNFSGLTQVSFAVDGRGHTFEDCDVLGTLNNAFVFADTSRNCRLDNCSALGIGVADDSQPGYITLRGRGHTVENTSSSGGRFGFYVAGSGHLLEDCDADGNVTSGYSCAATDTSFVDCDAGGNVTGFNGGGEGVIVRGGKFASNSSHGILVSVDSTQVIGATSQSNLGSGIYVQTGIARVDLRGNKIKNNFAEGIHLLGDSCWLEDNQASGGDTIIDAGSDNFGRGNTTKSGAQNDLP